MWVLILDAPLSALAHRSGAGFGTGTDVEPASNAYALSMAGVVGGMIVCLLGALLYFRWRSAHPLPEPDSVRTVLSDSPKTGDSGEEGWEKPADWWKSR